MRIRILITSIVLALTATNSFSAVIAIDVSLSSQAPKTPENAVYNAGQSIVDGLNNIAADKITAQQTQLLDTFTYINNNDPNANADIVKALTQISPKKNGGSTIVTRKSPSTMPVKGIGKRLSALRKSAKRSNFLSQSRQPKQSSAFELLPGLIKYNTDPQLASGGLLDQRISGFFSSSGIISEQTETSNESGFTGKTAQLIAGADYRINNDTFAGAAVSYSLGKMNMTQGGNLDNNTGTLVFYATRSLNQNWYTDATVNIGTRNFDMTRSINFNLNSTPAITENSQASSKPKGNIVGFSLGTGYDVALTNGNNFSFLASFNYTKSSIDAFQESGNSAYNLAIDKQAIISKMFHAGVEWRRAISTGFGVVLPQVSFKWAQELEDRSDTVNAYFVADPNQTRLNFETGNKDQGYLDLQVGLTAVFPRGLAAYAQLETQQFIDDYQQFMFSIGGRKEF